MKSLPKPFELHFEDNWEDLNGGESAARCIPMLNEITPTDQQLVDCFMLHQSTDFILGLQMQIAKMVGISYPNLDGLKDKAISHIADIYATLVAEVVGIKNNPVIDLSIPNQFAILVPSPQYVFDLDPIGLLKGSMVTLAPIVAHLISRNGRRDIFQKLQNEALFDYYANAMPYDIYRAMKVMLHQASNLNELHTEFFFQTSKAILASEIIKYGVWRDVEKVVAYNYNKAFALADSDAFMCALMSPDLRKGVTHPSRDLSMFKLSSFDTMKQVEHGSEIQVMLEQMLSTYALGEYGFTSSKFFVEDMKALDKAFVQIGFFGSREDYIGKEIK